MGTNIDWLQGLFNAFTALTPVGVVLIAVWGKFKEQQREIANTVVSEFAQHLVSKQELSVLERRLESVEMTQMEFGVIKAKLEHVDRRVAEVKQDVRESSDRLSTELTGAMEGVREQMKDNKETMLELIRFGKKP